MLTIADKFPAFAATAVVSDEPGKQFVQLTDQSFSGSWRVYFFWPKDFTFVCPTEIAGFALLDGQFRERGAQVLGVSIDSEYVHLAWRASHPDVRGVPFPMVADVRRELSSALGILDRREGVALRATFIVDPEDSIRWVSVHDLDVGRNPEEVLRVLDALQTGGLTPCGWQRGQRTLAA
jgi:peroxiredoxin (alkyl hydroperoxide reductase subunit C)